MKLWIQVGLLGGLILAGLGCGGGGGTQNPDESGSSRVPIYLTDAPGDFAQAWVTVKEIQVSGPGGTKTLYRDSAGATFDVASLNVQGQQQFALLAVADTPVGNNLQIKVTVDEDVTLIPKGSGNGTAYKLAGSSNGSKVFTYMQSRRESDPIVIDFILDEWQVQGSQVAAAVRAGDPARVLQGHHVDQAFGGILSALQGTSPNFTFILANQHSGVHVTTNSETQVSNEDGSQNSTLLNGVVAHVRGTYDPQTNTVIASAVIIRPTSHVQEATADGAVESVGSHTFTVAVHNAHGFHPAHSSMAVVTSASTTFAVLGVSRDSDQFYAALAQGAIVALHGSYDSNNNTFTATHVGLLRHGENQNHGVIVHGPISHFDVHGGKFDLAVRAFEGTEVSAGTVLHVVTSAHTQFDGTSMSHLVNGQSLRVAGTLDGNTLTATAVSLSHHP